VIDGVAGATRTNVGIAELAVSGDPGVVLATYALGSCLGITLWDAEAGVGGLLHVMLPESSLDPRRARVNPERFVDTGLPLLFHRCYALGARKDRLQVRVAGGASMRREGQEDQFKTGKRNLLALRQMLWKNGVFLQKADVGGSRSRSIFLHLDDGELLVKSEGSSYRL
jgi:chemotaxis protein CheD